MEIRKVSGKKELQELFQTILDSRTEYMKTALVEKPLVYLLGEGFSEKFMSERKRKQIHLKSLRFTQKDVDRSDHKDYGKLLKEARIAPKGYNLDYSIVLWDDSVAFIDDMTLNGLIIQDGDYSSEMNCWFDNLWNDAISCAEK